MKARDYQTYAVSSVYEYFKTKHGDPLIAMPTGTGKSVVIALLIQSIFAQFKRQRVLVMTHVKELIAQNYDKLMQVWPGAPAGVYSSGLGQKDDPRLPIIFAGIASLAKKVDLFGHIDLIIIDEAHLLSPDEKTMYRKVIAMLRTVNPLLKVIGLTATAYRLGQGKLVEEGGIFTDICVDMTAMEPFNWFIEQGYLSPLVPKRTETLLDAQGVHMRGGEFIANELQAAVDKRPLTEAAVKEMMEQAHDRRSWLVFCAGTDHSDHVAEMLNDYGISTVSVHSKMKGDRDKAIADWQALKVRCITNNNVMTTGIDHPALDFIGSMRATASPGLWVQMLGRGTRPLYAPGFDLDTAEGRLAAIAAGPKQDCLVLDFARNTRRLGPINDPCIPQKKGKGAGEAPVKLCDPCGTYNHASVRVCFNCGAAFPEPKLKIQASASTEAIIKQDMPVVELLTVDRVTYSVHTKQDRPPMLKVNYYCGMQNFHEFVCLQHEGYALHKARDWWRKRSGNEAPSTTLDALNRLNEVAVPTHISVHTNKKYPKILNVCFDGSAFNTQPANAQRPPANVRTGSKPAPPPQQAQKERFDDMDDDIPF